MTRLFAAVFALTGMLLVLVWGALSSVLIWPFAALPRGRRERWSMYGARWWAWMVVHGTLFVRLTLVGKENLPTERGYLVVSNHRSWVDVALLQLYTASQGVSKKEVAYIPFFGLNGWLTGAIFFDRTKRTARARVVAEARKLLGGGANLHVFPEGTRTRDGRLRDKVHLRLLETASEMGVPIVPVCCWGTEAAVPAVGVYAMPLREVGVEIGAPVLRAPGQTPEEHAAAAWERVKELCARHRADEPFTLPSRSGTPASSAG